MPLRVELVSPERILYEGEADVVVCRTSDGDIAFLSGHAPFLGALGTGPVVVRGGAGGDTRAAVHGGFVQVKDDRVIVLSDVAELADQVDVARAREAERRAEDALRSASPDQAAEAEAALRRARARLDVAGAR